MNFLDYAFVWCYGVDEYSLAMYFATLLTDDFCKLYVNAAREGKLKMYGKATPEKPGTIQPTCISDRPKVFQPFLWKMKELLEGQLKKKEFWITDEATLEKLGRFIYELVKAKKKLQQLNCNDMNDREETKVESYFSLCIIRCIVKWEVLGISNEAANN